MALRTIQDRLQRSPIFMLSKGWCPFCKKARSALDNLKLPYDVLEIEDELRQPLVDNASEYKDAIQHMTGSTSVPKVWIGGNLLGGCDDTLAAAADGSLLKKALEAIPGNTKEEKVINAEVNANIVFMISKEWCPYCASAKKHLDSIGAKYKVLEIENAARELIVEGDLEDWRMATKAVTGSTSVPKVFIAQQLLGGGDDVAAAAGDGSLKAKLEAAGGLLPTPSEDPVNNARFFSNGARVNRQAFEGKKDAMLDVTNTALYPFVAEVPSEADLHKA